VSIGGSLSMSAIDLMNQNQDPESEEAKQRQINHSERVQWWFQQEQEVPRRFNTFLKVEE